MQLKTIIYTTSKSSWIKNDFDKIYRTLRKTRGITVNDFEMRYLKLPENVKTYTELNGGTYIDWQWLKENLPNQNHNAICLHISSRDRERLQLKHPNPGAFLGGAYHRDSSDSKFWFIVIADPNRISYNNMSEFERLFLHELSHGFSFWRGGVDFTHFFDYTLKDMRAIFLTHDFTLWNSLVEKIKRLQEKVASLMADKTTLHAPIDIPFMSRISQPFGVKNPIYPLTGHHVGTDFAVPEGENCYALADGTVVRVIENHPTLGNATYFKFYWRGQYYTARYLHQSRPGTMGFKKRGDNVGVTGNTGKSTGPHLHFDTSLGDFNLIGINEKNFRNKFIDPMSFEYEGVKK